MFLNSDFLLRSNYAKHLYHNYAEKLPIIDYHCHLEAREIYENKNFENLTSIWLNNGGQGDHYKWRLMRSNGVCEKLISGEGDDYEKYREFVRTIELAVGNPVYEWSHLELRRYFGIKLPITVINAKMIWDEANKQLQNEKFKPKNLIKKMNVKLVATTDDPSSDLKFHQLLKKEEKVNGFKVIPTFRPDKLMNITDNSFKCYLDLLGQSANQTIITLNDLENVIYSRVTFFNKNGCRLADHGLNDFSYIKVRREEIEQIFTKKMNGDLLLKNEEIKYKSYIQLHLMCIYKKFNWTMQLHMNVFRNINRINFNKVGPDSGFDSVGNQTDLTAQLKKLYQDAEDEDSIPKSIWYSLNDSDWLSLATVMGCFQGEKQQQIQLGCAWWFNDTYNGIKKQLTIFAQQSLLGNFVGMLTDSRSLLSYPRHEYFRRVLCQLIGEWVEEGRLPEDYSYLGELIEKICFQNANEYFNFFE